MSVTQNDFYEVKTGAGCGYAISSVEMRHHFSENNGPLGFASGGPDVVFQYILSAFFVLAALAQIRMLLIYLGIVESALGITGSPQLVFIAALKAAVLNPIRAILCFVVPWPALLPSLSATLTIVPLVTLLAYFGAFGQNVANAAHPIKPMLTEKGRAEYPFEVIRFYSIWLGIGCLLTAVLWYLFAR